MTEEDDTFAYPTGSLPIQSELVQVRTKGSALYALLTAIIALALIGCVAALTWHGSVSGEAAMTFFAGIGVGAGVAVVAHVSSEAAARD